MLSLLLDSRKLTLLTFLTVKDVTKARRQLRCLLPAKAEDKRCAHVFAGHPQVKLRSVNTPRLSVHHCAACWCLQHSLLTWTLLFWAFLFLRLSLKWQSQERLMEVGLTFLLTPRKSAGNRRPTLDFTLKTRASCWHLRPAPPLPEVDAGSWAKTPKRKDG